MNASKRRSAASPARSARPTLLGRAVTGAFRRLSPVRKISTEKAVLAPVPSNIDDRTKLPDLKGELELTLLHANNDAQVDFIFVHGLGGGSRKTWSYSSEDRHFWPKEWLPEDPEFRHVRIHTFGYKADWVQKDDSRLGIHDFALSLLARIGHSPEIQRSKTKIVLVAHSMGGLVTKKAYILARQDPDFKEIANRMHTLYFLATPHRGSDLAKTLENILSISCGPKGYVKDLIPSSESIFSINDSFRHFAEDVQLWSFYETCTTNLGLMGALIVDKTSATLGYPREHSSLMNTDHRGICKFDNKTDPNYLVLRNAFITTIDEIKSQSAEKYKEQQSHLNDLTIVSEPPVVELTTLNQLRIAGSCNWISSRKCYSDWLTSGTNAQRPILWITGNAGFGKSVLSSYVISDIQQRNDRCCYFFFKHCNSTKFSVSECLRSLAYQIAVFDAEILKSLVEIQKEASSHEQWDEKMIWRKLFVGCIFKQRKTQKYFWILDGLDECRRFSALINLFIQIPSNLRILITSRTSPETTQCLNILSKTAEVYEIQELDTTDDLNNYINSRMHNLPAGSVEGQQMLKEKILMKACGSFLWVSLVVKELEQVFSEEAAEAKLNGVPEDMTGLYDRMIKTLLQNREAVILSKSLFMWTLLAFRPLSISELQLVLKIDTNQTVPNLGKVLPSICGQLVMVNQKMEAEFIHQTAKAYLLKQEEYAELRLEKGESHTRMAELCLKYLTGSSFKGQGSNKDIKLSRKQDGDFAAYACDYFSSHLQRCSSENTVIWELLCRFLSNNILTWLENLARRRALTNITRTAKNLQEYLRRRLKYLSPLSSEKDTMETWISDLIRLNARFGSYLSVSPSAITNLILPMCPSDSMIYQKYALKQRGLRVKGFCDKAWDDCLVRIDFPGRQTSAVACGERFSAVALSDGTILLYHQDSVQLKSTLNNKTRATILAFSNEDRYLASNAFRYVKVWDPEEGTQVWSFDTNNQPLTFLFLDDNSTLTTATNGNHILAWDLSDGQQVRKWQWTSSVDECSTTEKPAQAPGKALFSPDYQTLAVAYRGLPIYLFDIQSERFIGCCSREGRALPRGASNHYVVDALAFNTNVNVEVLTASYGDGELAVFDISTAELRHSIPEVHAHSLACSPSGNTIVTGSPRGTIQIFEFGGVDGDNLATLYKIDAYDDCIKSIAFSSDGLRFADIRGSQYRIWEPAALVCNDLGEGSQSEFSQAISLAPKSVSMMEGPLEAEITTMCCSSGGNIVFCGKQDGSVVCFDTRTSKQTSALYSHAAHARITSIVHFDKTSLLATADESGRILVNKISYQAKEIKKDKLLTEIRLEESITNLLLDPSGARILAISRTNAEIWTTNGEKVGFAITHNDDANFVNHQLSASHFVIIEHRSIRIVSWADSMEASILSQVPNELQLTITPPSPTISRTLDSKYRSVSAIERASPPYITKLFTAKSTSKVCCEFPVLNVWSASSILDSSIYPLPIQITGINLLTQKISQIIATIGSSIFFLDTNLWVCSLDLALATPETHGAKRHFFLLSEWQTIDGSFIIEYVPTSKEFVITRKHEILVISRGLDFAEPWFPT